MMKRKLNLLICIDSFYDGGVEIFTIRLADKLKDEFNITFLEVNPFLTKEKHQTKFIDTNVTPIIRAGQNLYGKWIFNGRKWFVKDLLWPNYNRRKASEVIRMIETRGIDIIHSHSWVSDTFLCNLNLHRDACIISSFHGEYEILLKHKATEDMITQTAKNLERINEVVYLSNAQYATLDRFGFPISHRHRIFHGLEFPIAKSLTSYTSAEVLRLVLVGRGIKEKGWEEAIIAVDVLNQQYPGKVQLDLIGHGDFLDEMKAKYRTTNIIFHGYQDNVRPFLEAAHIGLLPSCYAAESLPNTIIEFLFCGKPVVASNIGAIPEMLDAQGKVAGEIIPLQNEHQPGGKERTFVDPRQLASALERYILNPELVKQHSAFALQAADKFAMETCVEAYRNLYYSLPIQPGK